MNIERIAKNVIKGKDGIYYSKNISKISYPESGNDSCMQVEEDSFWFNHRNKLITSTVKKISNSNTFFDIGGGNGYVSKGLQDNGITTILVEPGLTGAKNAKKRKIKNVICSTLEDACFEKNSMEAVGLFDVVEHIENDVQFLEMINSYTKPSGHIYITVPSFNFLWSKNDNDAGHYRRYTLRKLKKKMRKAGFEIIYSTYIFSFLPLPVLLFRTIPSKLGLNKRSSSNGRGKKDHKVNKKGVLSLLLQKVLKWEEGRIKGFKRILFGGSCFVVGRKIQ